MLTLASWLGDMCVGLDSLCVVSYAHFGVAHCAEVLSSCVYPEVSGFNTILGLKEVWSCCTSMALNKTTVSTEGIYTLIVCILHGL